MLIINYFKVLIDGNENDVIALLGFIDVRSAWATTDHPVVTRKRKQHLPHLCSVSHDLMSLLIGQCLLSLRDNGCRRHLLTSLTLLDEWKMRACPLTLLLDLTL